MSLSLVGRNSRQTGHPESIDHFFGTDQKRVWNLDAERLVGLHVDDQLQLVGLLDREAARLGALPNLLHIAGSAPEHVSETRAVRDQTTHYDTVVKFFDRPRMAEKVPALNMLSNAGSANSHGDMRLAFFWRWPS